MDDNMSFAELLEEYFNKRERKSKVKNDKDFKNRVKYGSSCKLFLPCRKCKEPVRIHGGIPNLEHKRKKKMKEFCLRCKEIRFQEYLKKRETQQASN